MSATMVESIWDRAKEPAWEGSPIPLVLAIAAMVAVIAGCIIAVTYRSETRARADSFHWERSINIQSWQTVQRSDWSIPTGGRMIRVYQEIHHYEQYVSRSHEECSGTGKKQTCDTVLEYSSYPVWRDKYDYEIDEWVTVRTPGLQGFDQSPVWPDLSGLHTAHNPPQIGDERAGMRTSRYTVNFIAKDKTKYALDVSEERWSNVEVERTYTIVLNVFGFPLDFKE